MSRVKTGLTSVQETLLFTLYFRALDYRSRRPIIGDPWASEVLGQLDYNRRKLRMRSSDRFITLLRAKRLDDWTRAYLADHPDATVLHLGCGLDSRAFRLDVPAGVRWFDIDYPEVVELRKRLYPERDGYHVIASSVTDLGWLDEVPTDGPVLVIAEGLLTYLAERDVKRLFGQLTERFPHGELMFDAMTPWITKLSSLLRWPLRDPHEVQRWDSRLELVDHT